MIETMGAFAIGTLCSACCLWAGMKVLRVDGTFGTMLMIAATSSLLGLIPTVGWLIAAIAMYVLICKLTEAEIFPAPFLIIFLASVFRFFVGFCFLSMKFPDVFQ
jgi:hypothetical protein